MTIFIDERPAYVRVYFSPDATTPGIPVTADAGLIGIGKTKREALEQALEALSVGLSDCAQLRLELGPPKGFTDPEPLTDAEMNGESDELKLPL
jgi:hypothetical protein